MLQGKVAVVTGAARGMGRAAARALLQEGAKLVAIDQSWMPTGVSNDRDDLWRKELESRPGDALVLTCDIGDEAQVHAAYEEAMATFGTADFLFNNAGVRMRDLYPPSGVMVTIDTSWSDWERMFRVTVFGAVELCKLFVQPMIEKGSGSVLSTISSGALNFSRGGAYMALRPNSREVPYQPAKAALLCAMFYLADEVKQYNVAVNVLIPAHTRTTGFDEQTALRMLARGQTEVAGPQGTLPEHVVPLVTFLADQDAESGVTGRCFDAMTWNLESGHGGPERWIDTEGEAAVKEALQQLSAGR
jgi:NAD(P)-dependent dehydrogenase (short-subunit alcohol dehydrogenase family)